MNIILKQSDIEKAVRQHIVNQGISLRNKTLGITFNMGRGENGLSASLTIEDVEIPGFDQPEPLTGDTPAQPVTDHAADAAKPVLTAGNDMVQPAAAVQETTPSIVNGVPEVAKTAPATLVEAAEALLVPADLEGTKAADNVKAAIATPAAEAKVPAAVTAAFTEAETTMAQAETAAAETAPAKASTSLFS